MEEKKNCRSCGKEIVWLKTKSGKVMPIDKDTIQGKETIYDHTKGHISHFATCPQSNQWRK